MIELDEIDALAAEYVIGTLDRDERIAVATRRLAEPALDQAIAQWERRLGTMIEVVPPMTPPPNLYSKIRAQIGLAQHVQSLKRHEQDLLRRTVRWRRAAAGITAIAACLVGIIGWREVEHRSRTEVQVAAALERAKAEQRTLIEAHTKEIAALKAEQASMGTQYVAVLNSSKDTPAFLMTVDTRTHLCVITALAAPPQKDKAYEVWMLHEKMEKPKSLGVYSQGDMRPMPMGDDPEANAMFMNASFAVSLEPQGGSPTGTPTGPVVYTGRLLQATP